MNPLSSLQETRMWMNLLRKKTCGSQNLPNVVQTSDFEFCFGRQIFGHVKHFFSCGKVGEAFHSRSRRISSVLFPLMIYNLTV